MVKKLYKFLAFSLFFILAVMYFTPKVSVYYFAEEMLKEYGIIISKEEAVDNGLTLTLSHGIVSFKGIDSATLDELNIKLFGVYNSLDVNGVLLSSTAAAFVPLKIEHIEASYSVINPLYAIASAEGEFGSAELEFSILDNSIHLLLKPSKLMLQKYKSTLRNLKKNEEGEYVYDKTF